MKKIISTFLKKNSIAQEFLYFISIGCISFIANYGLFALLVIEVKTNYITSSALGYLAGVIVSYFGNKIVTFKSEAKFKKREFLIYCLIYLFSLGVSLCVLHATVTVLHISVFLANIIAIGVSTMTNFTGVKLFLFKTQLKP